MKGIKEKHAERRQKSNAAGKIPKEALKKVWTESKEKSRTNQAAGKHLHTGMVADTFHSAVKQNTDLSISYYM